MVGEDLQKSYDFLLDTGIVMRHLRNEKRAQDFLNFLEKIGEISVSAITYMEILVLCRPHEGESTKLFFERVPPLAVSKEVAHKAASLISKYPDVFGKQIGRGTPDALIAATAWHMQAILVTLNTRQFAKVPIAEIEVCSIKQNAKDWTSYLKL